MTNQMDCVLYQSPLAIKHLETVGINDDGSALVVELSMISILAPVFDAQAKLRVGLAGLLSDESRISKISRRYPGTKNPVILTSRPAVAVHSMIAALGLLKRLEFDQKRIVVMVHLSDARRFAYALQFMDSFSFLLDRDDPIPFTLPDAAGLLAQMHLINDDVWKGIVTFSRQGKIAATERREMWEQLQGEFGSQNVIPY